MRYAFVASALVASASAHGLVTSIEGANGVSMPGLSVADGTPRDCSSNGCGSQADTAIIRDRDMGSGRATALGRTQGNGPIEAASVIAMFMGANAGATAPTNNGSAGAAGQEDDLSQLKAAAAQRRAEHKRQIGNLFGGRLGGGGAGGAGGAGGGLGGLLGGGGAGGLLGGLGGGAGGGAATGLGGLLGGGGAGTKSNKPAETMIADTTGMGATGGLPTASDSGEVSMVFRQINQDGAGPLRADIDGTSGGTDPNAFQSAQVTQDVPGLGIQGLSLATNTDFPLKVQMPQGMTCDASVGGADNVCIVRVRNGAAAGPFGGSAAFTQTKAARKRAIAYRLKKRMELSREE
ncbi:cell surface protein [Sarocladium implicatum]|nr:cell surface protein [Sarocladium implicatum]